MCSYLVAMGDFPIGNLEEHSYNQLVLKLLKNVPMGGNSNVSLLFSVVSLVLSAIYQLLLHSVTFGYVITLYFVAI